jgi:membrane protease YdiL (CAAX protease family)
MEETGMKKTLRLVLTAPLLLGSLDGPCFAAAVQYAAAAKAAAGMISPVALPEAAGIASSQGMPNLGVALSFKTLSLPSPAPRVSAARAFSRRAARASIDEAKAPEAVPQTRALVKAAESIQADPAGKKAPGTLAALFEGWKGRLSSGVEAVKAGAESKLPAGEPALKAVLAAAPDSRREPPTPKKPSLSRSAKLALVLAGAELILEFVVPLAASYFGYAPSANYVRKLFGSSGVPGSALPTGASPLVPIVIMTIRGVMFAPLAEEVLYRGVLMEYLILGLSKIGIKKPAPFLGAALSSAVFTLTHETGDPVMMALRFAGALMLAYAYYHEGLMSSIALHAIHNAFPGFQAIVRILYGTGAKTAFSIAAFLVYSALAWVFVHQLSKGPKGAVSNRRYPWPEDPAPVNSNEQPRG